MDKNKIKSFAIWARRNLIAAVSEKANRIGITESNIEEAVAVQGGFQLKGKQEIFSLSKSNRDALVKEIKEKGFEQVMEEVAYTWFNRFMGLRYMEVNDYLPLGIRILSSEIEGKIEPDVLTKVSEVIDELNLNAEEIYTLLDSGKTEDREKAYRIILVKQCNELGKIIPQMFEKISDYTELLLPDNLLEEGSVIRKMVSDIAEEDWKEEVEIIGWMYQYYISEKKDEVFAALKKNVKITKENIPAATQLFTPKWIVKYMVENSLGRLWLEGHPNEELQKEWKYYLEEAEQEPEVEEELKKIREEHAKLTPEDIKVLDPCMGSGHILVYAFDVLYEIYKTAGYSEREIPRLILQNNLYGLDIDDRAAQLASFALIMKARHYNRRLFREIEREHLELNLCSIQESNSIHKEALDYFCSLDTGLDNDDLENDLEYLWSTFTDAKEYGSILEVDGEGINFEALKQRLKEIEEDDNLMFGDYRKMLLDKLPIMIKQAEIMSRKYNLCTTNPPYMGSKGMSEKLNIYISKRYKLAKSDMYSVFMEKGFEYIYDRGFNSMVTMHSWMFLGSFEELRKKYLDQYTFKSILHLGMEAFENIIGKVVQTAAFVISKNKNSGYKSVNIRLVDFYDSRKYEKEEQFFNPINRYDKVQQSKFSSIPGYTIAYWISEDMLRTFEIGKRMDLVAELKTGLVAGDNQKYFRAWYEVGFNKINFNIGSIQETKQVKSKWFPLNHGGDRKKYYGNHIEIVNFKNNAEEISSEKNSMLRNKTYYFKKGINYNRVGSTVNFAARISEKGFVFDDVSPSCFIDNEEDYFYLLGLMNTKLFNNILNIINTGLKTEIGHMSKLPIIITDDIDIKKYINKLVLENINICREFWDYEEVSWNYKGMVNKNINISIIVNQLIDYFTIKYEILKSNEQILNDTFSKIYMVNLNYKIIDKDITVSVKNREEIVKQIISYAVGCMLGRYSIDAEGLIYAGGDFDDKWDLDNKKVRKIEKDEDGNVISDSWVDATFIPDADNIIPITEDEYFEDDIVSRFIDFVRTVYGNDTLEENLDFIADSIGRKSSETARQAIRRYFIKDFYKDHLKVYQKRPIYWMFESGKNDGFKCLVYMHRYNDQTVAKVRTDYLHALQRKYEAEINRLQLVVDSEEYIAKDRNAAKKKIDRISKQIEECREYDQVVAHLANEKISIDLDDGVKVNYAKFQDIKVINSKGKEVKMNLLAKI